MSIALVRVDNRLIHGQILEAWVPHVKAERIVVVDDDSADDPLKRSILELATPRNIQLDIVTMHQAVDMFQANAFEPAQTIVLFSGPCQAYAAYRAGFHFEKLNIGNVHFARGKTRVSASVCVNQEEFEVLRSMAQSGVRIEIRAVPRENRRFITPDSGLGETLK